MAENDADLIEFDGETVASVLENAKSLPTYSSLKSYAGRAKSIRITSSKVAGVFFRADSDPATTDTYGMVFIDALGRVWKRQYSGPIQALWFGAKGDGVADDSVPLRRALAYLNTSTGTKSLELGGLKYKCLDYVQFYSEANIDGQGATLDFSEIPADGKTTPCLYGNASRGSEIAALADLIAGNIKATLPSGLELARNSMIKIYKNRLFDSQDRTNTKYGELQLIRSYNNTTGETEFSVPLSYSYLASEETKLLVISPLNNIVIQNLNIIGRKVRNEVSHTMGVSIFGALQPKILNCSFVGTSFSEITYIDCFQGIVSGCSFRETDQDEALGYGVSFANASRECLATNNVFFDKRHAYSTNNFGGYGASSSYGPTGVVFNCSFKDSTVHRATYFNLDESSFGDALDTHAASDWITYEGITVYGSVGTAVNLEGANNIVRNCQFKNMRIGGIVVRNFTNENGSFSLENVTIDSCPGRAVSITKPNNGTIGGYNHVNVSNCTFRNVGNDTLVGISIKGNETYQVPNVSITNILVDSNGVAVDVDYLLDGAILNGINVRGRGAESSGVVSVRRSKNILISNAKIHVKDDKSVGLFLTTIPDSMVTNCIITTDASTTVGITMLSFDENNTNNTMISNCRISGFNIGVFLTNTVTNTSVRNLNAAGCATSLKTGTGAGNEWSQIVPNTVIS